MQLLVEDLDDGGDSTEGDDIYERYEIKGLDLPEGLELPGEDRSGGEDSDEEEEDISEQHVPGNRVKEVVCVRACVRVFVCV